MRILDRLKFAFSNNFDERIKTFLTGGSETLQVVNTGTDSETAMKYSAVFACVRVLSETLASLPIFIYCKDKNGSRELGKELALYDILHNKPNSEMSAFNFKECCMSALCLGGNAYAMKLKNALGEVVGLYPYEWQKVRIDRDSNTKKLIYTIDNKQYDRNDIFHIPGLGFNGIKGMSPIEYSSNAISLGLTYEQFALNFYKNGANASGILQHPGVVSDKNGSFDRLRKQFQERFQGLANAGKPIILEEGMTYKELTMKLVDAQLLESKKFQLEDVARIYRVPLHLIQNLDKATNNNIEHQSLEFVMYTMLPWLKRWEENINMQLLTDEERKAGYYAEFKADALLRGDIKSRYEAYATGRQWGLLSINDVMKLENMNDVEGEEGDARIVPLNMINVSKLDEYYTRKEGE